MRNYFLIVLIVVSIIFNSCGKPDLNINYNNNPEPLARNAYIKLPLGTVKPDGWLKSQLEAQAAGLTGNLDDFWPDNEWRGVRAMENAVTGYWLFRQTGEQWILETIESIQKNSSDWTSYYEKFPWDSAASKDKKIPLN
jgi:uncharacterized protein